MSLKVTPDELRSGARKLDGEAAAIAAISVPDHTSAAAGLSGFATAATLPPAHDAVVSALKVAGGRFELVSRLLSNTAGTFELADMLGLVKPPWMSQQIADGLTDMGDMNLSRH